MTERSEKLSSLPKLLKAPEFIIPDNDPWKNDRFQREALAQKLYNLLHWGPSSAVVTLSAPFGTGKTTFLKCWHQQLSNNGEQSIIFNAWESDYLDDPFVAFSSFIFAQLPMKEKSKKALLEASKRVGMSILKNSPIILAKVAAKTALGDGYKDTIDEIIHDEDDLSGFAKDVVSDSFNSQIRIKDSIEKFRATFQEIVKNEFNGKLIVFIDETDRCRPTYAVELLEKIKHIFSVEGVVFILAVDQLHLEQSISGVYGANVDGEKYLKKFVDWDFSIPYPSLVNFVSDLCIRVFEFEKTNLLGSRDESPYPAILIGLFCALSSYWRTPIRDIERAVSWARAAAIDVKPVSKAASFAMAEFIRSVDKAIFEELRYWRWKGDFFAMESVERLLDGVGYRYYKDGPYVFFEHGDYGDFSLILDQKMPDSQKVLNSNDILWELLNFLSYYDPSTHTLNCPVSDTYFFDRFGTSLTDFKKSRLDKIKRQGGEHLFSFFAFEETAPFISH